MFRYLEVVSMFYEKILEDLRRPEEQVRKTVGEHQFDEYQALGKFS